MRAAAYSRLARMQTAGVTATVPVWGYLAGSHATGVFVTALGEWPVLLVLGALGISAHFFGFVHNELADREVDAKAAYRRPKPLPQGEIPLSTAWALALAGLIAGLFWAFLLGMSAGPWVFVLSAAAAALAAGYNVWGKSLVGGDLFLSGSIACFVFSGAAVAGDLHVIFSTGAVLVASLTGLIIFFNNGFEGGFKDHESDKLGGKRTLINALRDRSAKYDSPDGLIIFAQMAVHGVMWVMVALMVMGPFSAGPLYFDLARMGAAGAMVAMMAKLYVRGIAAPERKRMLTLFAAHEMLAVLLFPLILVPFFAPLLALALFVAPLLWFVAFNRVLYGTFAAPDV
jgi:4-hydroxybenzoate polyprenyltransferase